MKLSVSFSGQNKTDMKASLVKLSTSIMGNVFCGTSEEELAGRKAKEKCRRLWRHVKRESSCRKMRKDDDSGWGAVG